MAMSTKKSLMATMGTNPHEQDGRTGSGVCSPLPVHWNIIYEEMKI
jgi:hypothetical protein